MNNFIRVISSMIELEIRRVMHDRTEIYLRAVQPLLWLLIFGHVLSSLRAIPTGNIPYSDYILPGVLIQSTITVAIFFGLIIIWERESGILKKLVTSPSPKFAIVIGRSMAAGTRALLQAVFLIPVAVLIGINIIPNPIFLILAFLIIFLSSSGFAALSIMVASILRSRERFIGIGSVIIFPLFFASNSLYPISAMPDALQFIAKLNPMTYMVDAIRGLLITGDISLLLFDILVIILFDISMFALASRSFERILE